MAGRRGGEAMDEDGAQQEQLTVETGQQSALEEETGNSEVSLLQSFDRIDQEYRKMVGENQDLRSKYNAEVMKREALDVGYASLKEDNERLKKTQTETLVKLTQKLERHSDYQTLKELLNKAEMKISNMTTEHEKAMEKLVEEHQLKIANSEVQISSLELQKSANEATISHLQQDLAINKKQVDALKDSLTRLAGDTALQYQREIQELRDWIVVEQEEKNELLRKIQKAETELLIAKTKQAEQLRELVSSRHVETLKQKIMRLRKENETLKRQLANSDPADT